MKTINAIAFVGLSMAISFSGFALENPKKSKFDNRIQNSAYNKDDVVLVNGANGYATEIVFEEGEEITSYGSGYTDAWEFKSANNHFYLKPKAANANTNLFITTSKRSYSFDLKVVPSAKATYRVSFYYPETITAKIIEQQNQAFVEERLDSGIVQLNAKGDGLVPVAQANYNYTMNLGRKNSFSIAPLEAYDNQIYTVLRFKSNTDFPTVYRRTDDGQETLVNSHVESGVLVLHGVYKEIILRAGKSVVGVYNENYNGGAKPLETKVVIPGVKRTIKRKK